MGNFMKPSIMAIFLGVDLKIRSSLEWNFGMTLKICSWFRRVNSFLAESVHRFVNRTLARKKFRGWGGAVDKNIRFLKNFAHLGFVEHQIFKLKKI